MNIVPLVYIDDVTSRYLFNALNDLEIEYNSDKYVVNCVRFDWDSNNPSEMKRLFKVIEDNDSSYFFIDSALFDSKTNNNVRLFGIWIAYSIRVNVPRSHIAIVSSKHDEESSFAKPSFQFLEKYTKGCDNEFVLGQYKETIKMWLEDDAVYKKCCDEFNNIHDGLNDRLKNEITLSLARMESKDELSVENFKDIIAALRDAIKNEE